MKKIEDARPIGLLGAYERDNFGDLLFLERTRALLGADNSIALTTFSHTPELLTSSTPMTLATADSSSAARGLWVVGGEVGAVAVYAAYGMLDDGKKGEHFVGASRFKRRRIIRRASGARLTDLAYLPRATSLRNLASAPYIVNSVGLTGVDLLRGDMRLAAIAALREADFISVREQESSALLDDLGISHRLAPDLVHTLRLDYPELATKEARETARGMGRAVVQVSEAQLRSVGIDPLAHAIATSEALKGRHIRLFVAGTAPKHDSVELYDQLATAVRLINPQAKIDISTATEPLDKVRELATSSLVLATSLHAMIISMSFNVPHAGLFIPKVARYANCWKDPMPTGVPIREFGAAAIAAIDRGPSLEESDFADNLAESARDNALAAKAVTEDSDPTLARKREIGRAESKRELRSSLRNPRVIATRASRALLRPLS